MKPRCSIPCGGVGPRAAALLAGAVLLAAGALKLSDPAAFAWALRLHRLLPPGGAQAAAILLPWLELTVGAVLLFVPRLRRGGALLALTLYLGFSGAISFNLLRGVRAPCGCFGAGGFDLPAGWGHVALNLALAACSVAALCRHRASAADAGGES